MNYTASVFMKVYNRWMIFWLILFADPAFCKIIYIYLVEIIILVISDKLFQYPCNFVLSEVFIYTSSYAKLLER